MKTLITLSMFILLTTITLAPASATERVRGYHKSNGTYVQPHSRTNRDHSPYNNYSYPGNYNPNKGNISKGNQATYLNKYHSRGRN